MVKRKKQKSAANKLSSLLLGANKLVRDYNAISKGGPAIANRLARRYVGKQASKGLGSEIFKFFK